MRHTVLRTLVFAWLVGCSASDGAPTAPRVDAGVPSPDGAQAVGPSAADAADVAPVDAAEEALPDEVLHATVEVRAGATLDGRGRRYRAGPELGDGGQSESQQPLFRLASGATLKNVVLGAPAADGVHVYGDAQLVDVVWEDVGEDALTIKESGEVSVLGGAAYDADDKVFQINAPSTFRLSRFTAKRAGKLIRQNGGTTFAVQVYIDGCDIAQMDETIFRTDSETSRVQMTSTRYSAIGEALFVGVSPDNVSTSGNVEY